MEALPRKRARAGARLACSALLGGCCGWRTRRSLRARVGFAGYVETLGFDKAVLLANTGRHAVDLAAGDWRLAIYFNGARHPAALIPLRGTLAAHTRFWLINDQAEPRLRGAATQLTPELNFNGNDAVVLLHGDRIADSIGQVGDDPGSAWAARGVSTRDAVLVRRRGDIGLDRNPRDAFDPASQRRASTLEHLRKRHRPTRTHRIEQATIPAIQGSGLLSPLRGDRIGRVRGVVTAVTGDGFFMQAA